MFDARHYKDPFFWLVMLMICGGAGFALVCLSVKRLFGIGWMWWEHGSDRCQPHG
jgi:hypothetical protein